MSSSLGYRFNQDAPPAKPKVREVEPEPATTRTFLPLPSLQRPKMLNGMHLPRGFIPLLLSSALFVTLPLVYEYVSIDYTSDVTKGVTIGLAAVSAIALSMVRDAATLYNLAYFFHIGVEVKVLDILYAYAQNADTTGMALAWTAFGVIALHLVPFLITDRAMLLGVLAFVGVILNAAVLVYLDTARLLLVGFSSAVLLGVTILVPGKLCDCSCMMSQLRVRDSSWIVC